MHTCTEEQRNRETKKSRARARETHTHTHLMDNTLSMEPMANTLLVLDHDPQEIFLGCFPRTGVVLRLSLLYRSRLPFAVPMASCGPSLDHCRNVGSFMLVSMRCVFRDVESHRVIFGFPSCSKANIWAAHTIHTNVPQWCVHARMCTRVRVYTNQQQPRNRAGSHLAFAVPFQNFAAAVFERDFVDLFTVAVKDVHEPWTTAKAAGETGKRVHTGDRRQKETQSERERERESDSDTTLTAATHRKSTAHTHKHTTHCNNAVNTAKVQSQLRKKQRKNGSKSCRCTPDSQRKGVDTQPVTLTATGVSWRRFSHIRIWNILAHPMVPINIPLPAGAAW